MTTAYLGFDYGLHLDAESKRMLKLFGIGVLFGLADLFGVFLLTRSAMDALLAYAVPWSLSILYVGFLPLALFPIRRRLSGRPLAHPRLLLLLRGFRFAWLPALFIAVAIYLIVAYP